LWRATTVFRIAGAAFSVLAILLVHSRYEHPAAGIAAGVMIVAITVVIGRLGWTGRAHRPVVISLDLIACLLLTLFTIYVQYDDQLHQQRGGLVTLTTVWAAGPVIEFGLVTGWLGGLVTGLASAAVSMVVREDWRDGHTITNGALLVIVGVIAGYVAAVTTRAEAELVAVSGQRAAIAERERLARSIHDGVLQVLGLMHRNASAAGGDWAELGAAAAEQELALRGLITSSPALDEDPGKVDLAAALTALRSATVSVSVPAGPLQLSRLQVNELVAIVTAALHNVGQHAGAGADSWVLLEDLGDDIAVTVRDDGVGMPAERPAEAAEAGRLGISRSIRGRAADLGGRVDIHSEPGSGTEIEVVIPRTTPTGSRL
jgi:signal transduction histidine kinase